MAVATFSGRPPADAVAYLRDKMPGGRLSFDWRDVWQEEHLTSFVVAKMDSQALLTDVHAALTRAITEGWTRDRFITELRPTLEKAGWWGRQEKTDPVTGLAREVQLGSPRRLKTIYDTNMRMAQASGRWERFQAAKAGMPYLVYTAVLDERTRPLHARWGGRGGVRIVLPIDHPFWLTHYPPNGWRCRCIVIAANDAMLKARGWTVTSEEELEALDWKKTKPWLNRRTGRMMTVPAGIDPGFAYNVGMGRRAALAPPPISEPQRDIVQGERYPRTLPATRKPRPYPAGVAKTPDLSGDAVFNAFVQTLGTPAGGVFFDKVQTPLSIEPTLFQTRDAAGAVVASKADKAGRGAYAQVFAATLKDPDEIWMSAQLQANGQVRLVRSYVAAWDDPDGERYWMTVVFSERDGWWWGTTAFAPNPPRPKAERYTSKNGRIGTLVYRRK